jgi:hypothetical protein
MPQLPFKFRTQKQDQPLKRNFVVTSNNKLLKLAATMYLHVVLISLNIRVTVHLGALDEEGCELVSQSLEAVSVV